MNIKTKELRVRIVLRISKQESYKSFVLILMPDCQGIALFWGKFITMSVHS
jgi:hypothetical protein